MGLFSKKKDLPEELKAVRLKPKPYGTRAFPLYVTAVTNKDLEKKDPIKWLKHIDRSEKTQLIGYLEDGLYKIIDMEEVSKVGIFYKVQPEDREDKEGVWVAKDDIWESDS